MNAKEECFLVTGALGCIGAWSCAQLVREDVPVILYDLGTNRERLELIMSPDELEQPTLLHGDVTDLDHLEQTIRENGITHVIHLAAMLVPLVKADPTRGAAVNVVGTTNVFEAAKRQGVRGIAYASSAAVYGPDSGPRIEDAGEPTTLYGVFKLANEGTANIYFDDYGVGSVGLRPYVVYGPGRDQGLTADPTLAMEAAARGEGFEMRWGGRCQLQYAADAARIFIAAARAEHGGAAVFN
ncbi:MAG: NAD-dependent epimerase/dehydratase family protein, partial [Gaiellaceae bacterium]